MHDMLIHTSCDGIRSSHATAQLTNGALGSDRCPERLKGFSHCSTMGLLSYFRRLLLETIHNDSARAAQRPQKITPYRNRTISIDNQNPRPIHQARCSPIATLIAAIAQVARTRHLAPCAGCTAAKWPPLFSASARLGREAALPSTACSA